LHDFGKVAVPEDVLLKAKKLPPALWERIDARFDLIGRTMELESCRARGRTSTADADGALAARLNELGRYREVVRDANEPAVLDTPTAAELLAISRCTYERPDGAIAPYLTPEELHFLQLPKGTLDDRERAEVESHVTATQQYLSTIPWTDDLKNMVTYASGHHELLNGDGYPRHLRADDIPLQTRIITLADMFDALTSSDRPYKHSVTAERALEILRAEAAAGRLDAELVKVMAESASYRKAPATIWREM
jgi:response regulator RpfG family c-di-GMP phosphodiesterase